jgi:hypothetical protein
MAVGSTVSCLNLTSYIKLKIPHLKLILISADAVIIAQLYASHGGFFLKVCSNVAIRKMRSLNLYPTNVENWASS